MRLNSSDRPPLRDDLIVLAMVIVAVVALTVEGLRVGRATVRVPDADVCAVIPSTLEPELQPDGSCLIHGYVEALSAGLVRVSVGRHGRGDSVDVRAPP